MEFWDATTDALGIVFKMMLLVQRLTDQWKRVNK